MRLQTGTAPLLPAALDPISAVPLELGTRACGALEADTASDRFSVGVPFHWCATVSNAEPGTSSRQNFFPSSSICNGPSLSSLA
jgi:hypothetical protein